MSLVRAAWERRPEGPTYLLSSVMLLYIAGQCALFCTHFPPWTSGTRGVFPSSRGRILLRENPRSLRLEIHFLWTLSLDSAAQVKNFFVFGCGLWYDRVRDRATPPTTRTMRISPERDYEGDYEETLPKGRKEADGCKPRHGRDNEKGDLSCSGLRATFSY